MANLSVVVCLALDPRSSADGRAKFKACVSQCRFVDTTWEVAGSFDLIIQGRCASLAEYLERMETLRPQLAEYVTRLEANFVSRRMDRKCADDEAGTLWLPCEDGHKRVDAHLIDKIVAEGDYMRVHMREWSCVVHSKCVASRSD
jgi:hypothetical protein